MHKLRVSRTPLIAVLGFLAFLVVPAAAQAHTVTTTASCAYVGNQPTVTLTVEFTEFTLSSQTTLEGSVWLEGVNGSERSLSDLPPLVWSNPQGKATLTTSWPVDGGKPYTAKTAFSWQAFQGAPVSQATGSATTGVCPSPPVKHPGIKVVKDGPASAYVGDQVTFTFDVTNTGDTVLTDLDVSDDKCAPLTKVTQDNQFDPGDVWNYTCTTTITDAMGDELVNTVEACGKYGNQDVCDTDDHKTKIPKPKVELEKTGAATAAAGATFTYSFKATNTGNVTLQNVQLTDDKCQSTLTRVEPNLADTSFDVGDQWYYACTVVAPAGPAQVDNVAKVCGDYDDDTVEKMTVCDEDTHTFTVPPPTTPPTGNPPSSTPNGVPPTTTPDGEVLPEEILSGRAQLRGPSGCVRQAFRARVSGRSIASVTFFVDGRRVKRVGRGGAFTLKVNPRRYGLGRHTVVAVVRFRAESGTKARRLPLTFRRCAQGAVAPRFTG